MKKIKIIEKKTKKRFEFICFSTAHPNIFFYKQYPQEDICEAGFIDNFKPINITWKKIRQLESKKLY